VSHPEKKKKSTPTGSASEQKKEGHTGRKKGVGEKNRKKRKEKKGERIDLAPSPKRNSRKWIYDRGIRTESGREESSRKASPPKKRKEPPRCSAVRKPICMQPRQGRRREKEEGRLSRQEKKKKATAPSIGRGGKSHLPLARPPWDERRREEVSPSPNSLTLKEGRAY